MAGKLTLIYLNGKGRAEHIRLILAAAGRDYEDKRISFKEFATFKSDKSDGKRHSDSLGSQNAIIFCGFVGKDQLRV